MGLKRFWACVNEKESQLNYGFDTWAQVQMRIKLDF